MPSLRALDMTRSPLADPISYPGIAPTGDALLVGTWLYPLTSADEPAGRQVTVDGGPLAELAPAGATIPLGEALRRLGAADVEARQPVLAVGSNGSPAQLRNKLGEPVVPMTRVRVRGLMIGHSAHVSMAGYLPYTPVAAADAPPAELVCLWLDAAQRRRVDETEPNYRPLALDASWLLGPSLVVGGATATLYRSRWGALRTEPTAGPLPALDQATVYGWLGGQRWFQRLVPEHRDGPDAAAAALGADRLRRELVRDRFAELSLVAPDGLPDSA